MSDTLFDEFVDGYEDACARGVSLSGESRDYFARLRISHSRRFCSSTPIQRILDFGCGMGHSTTYLVESFPNATVIGVDTSARAIQWAQEHYGRDRVMFTTPASADRIGRIDLVYSNGTFHHIDPRDREAVVRRIFGWLRPGGLFALWENNPWNPGTRLVMKRIPFDRDAKTLSSLESARLLRAAGFQVSAASFHFYFPSWLRPLRRFEARLTRLPLGAQYCVLGVKSQNLGSGS
jgi:SAM-dependent methyltransferase